LQLTTSTVYLPNEAIATHSVSRVAVELKLGLTSTVANEEECIRNI
jgi:hypothetical protein